MLWYAYGRAPKFCIFAEYILNRIFDHLFVLLVSWIGCGNFLCTSRTSSSVVTMATTWAASWKNQQNGMCAQRRLSSAWASAHSDQSLRCLHEENIGSLATHWAHNRDSVQTGRMPGLIWVFAGRTVILLLLSWGGSIILNTLRQKLPP